MAFALVVAVPSVAVPSSGHAINQTIRATAFTFIPAVMVILDDDTLTFNNLDPLSILLGGHTVTADTPPGGVPLFDTPFVDFNTSQPVKRPNGQGIDTLQPDTYLFHCANHPDMHGVLQILPV